MSLTEKIKNTASDVVSWANENKKTLGLTTLGLYMGLIGCSNEPNIKKIVPLEVTRVGNSVVFGGYDEDSTKAVVVLPWIYGPISNGIKDIQREIDDGDNEPIEIEVLKNAEGNYIAKPRMINKVPYRG